MENARMPTPNGGTKVFDQCRKMRRIGLGERLVAVTCLVVRDRGGKLVILTSTLARFVDEEKLKWLSVLVSIREPSQFDST